jgi:hypothetical protein
MTLMSSLVISPHAAGLQLDFCEFAFLWVSGGLISICISSFPAIDALVPMQVALLDALTFPPDNMHYSMHYSFPLILPVCTFIA